MSEVRIETNKAVSKEALSKIQPVIQAANKTLINRSGEGNEFLGWLDLPSVPNKEEYQRIKSVAKQVQSNSEVLVVIGIGGSYLGTKAAFEFLKHRFYNQIAKPDRKFPEIYFAGINISSDYLHDLIEVIGDRDFSINMISKSGTTTEPAIAFRILKQLLIDKYGKEGAVKRIIATTDAKKGALKKLALEEGYESFIVPDNVGGRFSVLTAVGLFPLAVIGVDIDKMIEGAKVAENDSLNNYDSNPVLQYAAARNILYNSGKKIEILINYDPRLQYLSEWWKQLYGESEGKGHKGIFPASANFTADLHSMGQYIQDGERQLFETAILIKKSDRQITLGQVEGNPDGLNYLAGKTLDYINQKAAEGTLAAHLEGEVPNLLIEIDNANEHTLGYLFYFFEKACAISGYALGVNPFDQPGVEAYKKNMFDLLGKPKS